MNKIYITILLLILSYGASAQIEMTGSNTPPYDPISLISDQFFGEGVEVVNITYNGMDASVGYFSNGMSSIGIENGILLSTGSVESKGADVGSDQSGLIEASVDNGSSTIDVDLSTFTSQSIFNVTQYVIEFIPSSDTISFRYVFASEEYPEFVCSDYNDVFGFFVSGPGINGPYSDGAENIALIPGTNLPVTINNINSGNIGTQGKIENCTAPEGSLNYSEYYVDNDGSSMSPVFDGWLVPIEAKIGVTPCMTYKIKIVVADVGDAQRDSGVFLEGKSFDSQVLDVDIEVDNPERILIEGCNSANVILKIDEPRAQDLDINITYLGSASMMDDYNTLNSTITIPAGQTSTSLNISAIEDNIEENIEELQMIIDINACLKDTFELFLADYDPAELGLQADTICMGGSSQLEIDLESPSSLTVQSNDVNKAIISPIPGQSPSLVSSLLEVNGIKPSFLTADIIQSICLDITHTRLQDLSVYLASPGGQRITLTSGNGGTDDHYSNTCFTSTATDNVRTGTAPFTGNWLPEESFDNLLSGVAPLNGNWYIEIVDNGPGFNGLLNSWEITFNPAYEITYLWSNDASLSCTDCPNPIATPTSTSTYSVTVSNGTGCDVVEEVQIVVNESDFADAGPDQTICAGSDVTLTASGGDTYNWSTGDNTADINISPSTTTTYVVSITDANGCMSTDDVQIIVGTSLSADLQTTDVSCHQEADGRIIANSSGTAPFTYNWSNGEQTQEINGLEPGTYTVSISDVNNCNTVESAEIVEPDPLTITTDNSSTCPEITDGTATVTITGGNRAPFIYEWSSNAGGQQSAEITGLAAGIYDVTVTDDNNCTAIATTEVAALPELLEPIVTCGQVTSDAITFIWPDDANTTDFEVNVQNIGWTNPTSRTSHTLSGLSLGQTLEIQVRANGNCPSKIGTASCTANDCTPIDIQIVNQTNLPCAGTGSGSVSLIASGDNAPFSYSIDGQSNTTGNFANLGLGNHTATVEDAIGCTQTIIIVITEPDPLLISGTIDRQPDCNNGGAITVTASGGTGTLSYNWNNGLTSTSETNLPAGSYFISVTDENGCGNTYNGVINYYAEMTGVISSTPASCATQNAQATVDISGGQGSYSYIWDDAQEQTSSTAVDLGAGTYTVTVTDELGCTIEKSTAISEPRIEVELALRQPVCPEDFGGISITPIEGQAPFAIRVNSNTYSNQMEIDWLQSGSYDIEVTDNLGCTQTFEDEVLQSNDPMSVGLTDVIPLDIGDSIRLMPIILNGLGTITYEWTAQDDTYFSCTDCERPYFKPTNSTDIQLMITDANGCTASALSKVVVDRNRKIYAPDAISPNKDGVNDLFTIFTKDEGIIENLMIFDRWGNLVFEKEEFETNEESLGWNGRFNNVAVNSRLFVYVVRIRFEDEVVTFNGSLVVVR